MITPEMEMYMDAIRALDTDMPRGHYRPLSRHKPQKNIVAKSKKRRKMKKASKRRNRR